MALFNITRKTDKIKAPMSIYKLLRKIGKLNLPLRHQEEAYINAKGYIKVSKPILVRKKTTIKITFEKDGEAIEIKCFRAKRTYIKVCKEELEMWNIFDTNAPSVQKVTVSYLTENTNDCYKLVVINGELYIKSSYDCKEVVILNNGFLKDSKENLVIDMKEKKSYPTKDKKPTQFKDTATNKTYYLSVDKTGTLELVELPQL